MKRVAPPLSIQAVSLIELLVAISIMLILASFLFPWVSSLRTKAGTVGCLNNLRTLGTGIMSYAADNNGQLLMNETPNSDINPSPVVWYETLAPYMGYSAIDYKDPVKIRHTSLVCPSETDFTTTPYYCYSMNIDLDYRLQGDKARIRLAALSNASHYVLLCDSFRSHIMYTSFQQRMTDWTQMTRRHNGKPNCLYADGHVAPFADKLIGYLEVQPDNQAYYYKMYFANGIYPSQR